MCLVIPHADERMLIHLTNLDLKRGSVCGGAVLPVHGEDVVAGEPLLARPVHANAQGGAAFLTHCAAAPVGVFMKACSLYWRAGRQARRLRLGDQGHGRGEEG